MVSWYYHCLFKNEHHNARLVEKVRKDLRFDDYDDIMSNLPAFVEYAFTQQKHPSFSWVDFVRVWHERDVVHVRYEDLRKDTPGELQRIVHELTGKMIAEDLATQIAEEFSFERMAGRKAGSENKGSFMRKGIVGDWRNSFSDEARRAFDHFAGEELMKLGYEAGHSWVNH